MSVHADPSRHHTALTTLQECLPPGGHLVTDAHGLIQLADQAAMDMLKVSWRDLIGCPLPDVLAPDDRAAAQRQLLKLEQGEPGLEWAMTLAPKGLRSFSALLTISALRDASGKMAAVHWVIRDCSVWTRRVAGDRALQALGEDVLDGLSLPHILSRLCERVIQLVACPLVRVAIRGTEDRLVCAQAGAVGVNAEQACDEWTRDERRELASVLETHGTLHLHAESDQAEGTMPGAGHYPARLLVPLRTRDRAVGVLALYGASREAFDACAIQWCEMFAGRVTHFVAIHQDMAVRKDMEARIFHLAHHDSLTGLPNRTLFYDRLTQALAQARRHGRGVGVLFVDLDHFKAINDSLGHETGDAFLKIVADRLLRCVRATDTVARLSGDEFTVILQDVDCGQNAEHVARNILKAVMQPAMFGQQRLHVTASVGIAMYPFNATDPDVLLAQADRAMYRAKKQGGHCCQFLDVP